MRMPQPFTPFRFMGAVMLTLVLIGPRIASAQAVLPPQALPPPGLVAGIVSALQMTAPVAQTKAVSTDTWHWTQVQYADEAYPLLIDIVSSRLQRPSKILYLFPGGGLTFQTDYFTPSDNNLAHFFRQRDYLIVGITPRENSVGAAANFAFMSDWGLAKHKQDFRKIIQIIQQQLAMRYDVLGHSAGAMAALDYAASFSDQLEKVMLLDIVGPYDPQTEAQFKTNSLASYNAHVQLLQNGSFVNTSIAGFKTLVTLATLFPTANSGTPRSVFGGPAGNFTLEGLEHFALIHTNLLPGPSTAFSGLPDSWFYRQGFLNGTYTFNPDPLQDQYTLGKTPLGTVWLAVQALDSGLNPNAYRRDLFAVFAGNGACSINWSGINEKVVWVNGELGFGNHDYGARLIQQGGNQQVKFSVVPGYGHADMTFSSTADKDVWLQLLQ